MHILFLSFHHSSGIPDGRIVIAQEMKRAVNHEAIDFICNGDSVFPGLFPGAIDIQIDLSFQPGPPFEEKADDIRAVIMPQELTVHLPAAPGIQDYHGHLRPSHSFTPEDGPNGLPNRRRPDFPEAMGVHNRDRQRWSGVHQISSGYCPSRGMGSPLDRRREGAAF
jgi:hypothetical protein